MRVGEAARLSAEPSVAEAGEKLVDSALRLRLFALQATAKLYIGILLPGMRVSALALADSYERMTGWVSYWDGCNLPSATLTSPSRVCDLSNTNHSVLIELPTT